MLRGWVTGIGASESKGALGFVLHCRAPVETSVHCSTQLLILMFYSCLGFNICVGNGHKMHIFLISLFQLCSVFLCVKQLVFMEYGAGSHTCQKQRVGGQLHGELYKDGRQKCEWRVNVSVRLRFTTCARPGPSAGHVT